MDIVNRFKKLRDFTRISFFLRLSAFSVASILILVYFQETSHALITIFVAVVAFLWPFVGLGLCMISDDKEMEARNTLIDGFVSGFISGMIHAPLFFALTVILVINVSSLSTYGWKHFFIQISIFIVTITITLSLVGFDIRLFPRDHLNYIMIFFMSMFLILWWAVGLNRIHFTKMITEKLLREQQSLDNLSEILSSTEQKGIDELMLKINKFLFEEINFDTSILYIYEKSTNTLRQNFTYSKYRADTFFSSSKPMVVELDSDHGILSSLFTQDHSLVQEEISSADIKSASDLHLYSIQPFSSILAVPIFAANNKIGMMVLLLRNAHLSVSQEALNKLTQYMFHIAFIINNEILYQESLETTKSLQETNKSLSNLFGKVSNYLSPQITANLFSHVQNTETHLQRRYLTVYCSDIENFTKISESLSPEELQKLLNTYLNAMTSVVVQYGGTIDKYIGDMITVFFGDPETKGYKQDAITCAKMAIALNERLERLREEWLSEGIIQTFKIRSAIHSGISLVGNIGGSKRQEYTLYGDLISISMALQTKAPSGKIILSKNSYDLINTNFLCKDYLAPSNHKKHEHTESYYLIEREYTDEELKNYHIKCQSEHCNFTLSPADIVVSDKTMIKNVLCFVRSMFPSNQNPVKNLFSYVKRVLRF